MSEKKFDPIRILVIIVCLLAVIAAFQLIAGCTKREEANAKKTGGAVVGLFGLPPALGEGLVGLALLVSNTITHKNARRIERRCHVPRKPLVTP